MRGKRATYVVGLLVPLILIAGTAVGIVGRSANTGQTSVQREVLSITSDLRAPGDPSTVAQSSLGLALNMKYQVQQYVDQGMTKDQVLQLMVRQYGPNVLAAPRFQGFGRFAWAIPWLAVIAIFAGVAFFLRRIAIRQGTLAAASSGLTSNGSEVLPDRDATGSERRESNTQQIEERLRDYL